MTFIQSGLLGAAALVCLMLIDPTTSNAQSNGYRKNIESGWGGSSPYVYRRSDPRKYGPNDGPTPADPSFGYYPRLWEAQRQGGCYTDEGYGRVSGCSNR